MKLKLLKKLNSKGFSHHLIIPVIAIIAVAGIGAFVVTRSQAATCTNATTCDYQATKTYQTIKSVTGTWKFSSTNSQNRVLMGGVSAPAGKYKICITGNSFSGMTIRDIAIYTYASLGYDIGGNSNTHGAVYSTTNICYYTSIATSRKINEAYLTNQGYSKSSGIVTKVYLQHYK